MSEIEELSAKAVYENLKPAYIEVENSYKQAVLNFKIMIGLKDEINPELISNIPDAKDYKFDYKELNNKYINRKLEIQALNLGLQSLNNLRNINISLLTPSFVISHSVDYLYKKDAIKDMYWFNNNLNADGSVNSPWTDNWTQQNGMLTLALNLPLSAWLPFSAEQMRVVSTSLTISETEKSLEQLKLYSKSEIQSIVQNIEKSLKSMETLKVNIELSQKVYEMTNDSYLVGLKKLDEVKDAENELNNAKLNYLKQEFDYTSNLLDLEYSLNTKVEDLIKY